MNDSLEPRAERNVIMPTTVCIEADGAKPQRFAHGPFHLVLVEILHQPQYLDELAPSRGPHPSFYKSPQPPLMVDRGPMG